MDTLIAMQDIRNSLASIADRAESGESFIVVRNSHPAFRIAPLSDAAATINKPPRQPTVCEVRERFSTYPVAKDELAAHELDAIIREVRTRPNAPARP
jgi:antitoxin (DNA-binding transcriptional repressor) of toxin-antitoxin stability system